MLPVAQLYLRDIPLLQPPGQADLLQVLWCPYDHDPHHKPATALFWRSAAEVGDILATPPEPYEVNDDGYLPEPCVLAPKAITEYPNSFDLSPQTLLTVEDWGRWQAAGADVGSSEHADCPRHFYDVHLADAPGWKVGGWPPWGRTNPNPRYCTVCDVQMVPLLTIASYEWDGGEGHRAGHPTKNRPPPTQPVIAVASAPRSRPRSKSAAPTTCKSTSARPLPSIRTPT